MKPPDDAPDRRGRADRLRAAWRKDDRAARESATDRDEALDRRRDDVALGSNDRIRAEDPDDLENRRRADQLEREIKRSRHGDQG